MTRTADDDEHDDGLPSHRRVWGKRSRAHGTSRLALECFGVLYDAGEPLTRDEIADRLIPRLDEYDRWYFGAWYSRQLAIQSRADRRRRGKPAIPANQLTGMASDYDLPRVVRLWLTRVFLKRVSQGHTLDHLPDGRVRPGPNPPVIVTLDERRLRYTPDVRQQLEREQADARARYLADLEVTRLLKRARLTTSDARGRVLGWLLRRVGLTTGQAIDERAIGRHADHLLRLANDPTMQRAILQRLFDAMWEK